MTVDPGRWQKIKDTFAAAVELEEGARAAFLEEACRGDPELLNEVRSLLQAHTNSGDFIERSAVEEAFGLEPGFVRQSWIGRRVGVYRIVAEIGSGGMSEVYRAVRDDDEYHKEVAVKLLRSGFDTHALLKRFKIEKQILATLDHPNIAKLLDGGSTEEGLPFLVMDYIPGSPIDEYCASRRLRVRQRLELFLTLCRAVQHVHQHLMVHGDLKCSNVLVKDDGTVKLLDFGIARLLTPAQPLSTGDAAPTALVALTPDYASPEQIRGGAITTASDVYSLGVMLFRLLTGTLPYRLSNGVAYQLATQICEVEAPLPSVALRASKASDLPVFWREVRGDLDNIVLRSLEKDPARRYQGVDELSADIVRHLQGFPIKAREAGVPYRLVKFLRRNRTAVVAASLIGLALLGGILATSWQAQVASEQRARAEHRFDDGRALARSLVFELDESIRKLPGAVVGRKIIIERSLQYLDNLAQESHGDVSLERELAAEFERIGDLQDGAFADNTGRTAGSLESYRKALSIRAAVVQAQPTSLQDRLALAHSYRRLTLAAWGHGDRAAALQYARNAVAEANRLIQQQPRNLEVVSERTAAYNALATVQTGNGTGSSGGGK
jgi:eukaryotic-like serine/threonine-protein kinase